MPRHQLFQIMSVPDKVRLPRTNVIVVTVALYDDVRQLSPRIERLSRVVVHWDGLDERAQIFEFDVGIVRSSAASCVKEEDGLSGGYDLGVDEGVLHPNVVPFFDEERAGG